tara:strand:- start:9749 stop:9961 length:213 start_codon:yes stop_codon:yes gene_type:complete
MSEVQTAEEIAQHYSAMGDSVDLLAAGQPAGMSDAEWADSVSRNKEHLSLMIAKDFWTTEDLTAATAAAA